jgi:hypothetical protein
MDKMLKEWLSPEKISRRAGANAIEKALTAA